jgi:hypothetical protein
MADIENDLSAPWANHQRLIAVQGEAIVASWFCAADTHFRPRSQSTERKMAAFYLVSNMVIFGS